MTLSVSTKVSEIAGIGKRVEKSLSKIRIIYVIDLLRKSRWEIYSHVKSLASAEQVRYWYRCAQLLQVDQMTAQWAEAFIKNNIESVEELSFQDVNHIQKIMDGAHLDGMIPNVPTLNQISIMIKDAAILHYTGHIDGAVINEKKKPVAGATLTIGAIPQQTNSKGHFRLLRIPLGRPSELLIEHSKYFPLIVDSPNILDDIQTIAPQIFNLQKKSSTNQVKKTLSELNGDIIPNYKQNISKLVKINISKIQEGDLFFVYEFYKSSGDVKLVSYLKKYRNGNIIVNYVQIPRVKLPAKTKKGAQFKFKGKKFNPVKMSYRQIYRYKILLRMRKNFPNHPKIANTKEFWSEFNKRAQFLKEEGFFQFSIERKNKHGT